MVLVLKNVNIYMCVCNIWDRVNTFVYKWKRYAIFTEILFLEKGYYETLFKSYLKDGSLNESICSLWVETKKHGLEATT